MLKRSPAERELTTIGRPPWPLVRVVTGVAQPRTRTTRLFCTSPRGKTQRAGKGHQRGSDAGKRVFTPHALKVPGTCERLTNARFGNRKRDGQQLGKSPGRQTCLQKR
jgi:hypothetical protein